MSNGHMKQRKGISLIEVLVAVSLLGLIATVHTAVTLRYSIRNRTAAIGVDRATAISTAVDMYATMPFASLPASGSTTCETVTTLVNYRHQRCVTVTSPTQAIRRIEITITPTNTAFLPDRVLVDRSLPPTGSIFS
jgi:prepilin-type N-terminal cleavage/methylation domain-containing protein